MKDQLPTLLIETYSHIKENFREMAEHLMAIQHVGDRLF